MGKWVIGKITFVKEVKSINEWESSSKTSIPLFQYSKYEQN